MRTLLPLGLFLFAISCVDPAATPSDDAGRLTDAGDGPGTLTDGGGDDAGVAEQDGGANGDAGVPRDDAGPGSDAGTGADAGAGADAGTSVDAGGANPADPGPLPDLGSPPFGYNTTPPNGGDPERCRTGQWWRFVDAESERMHPGGDCIQCHADRNRGPTFGFAGTVMGEYDDDTDCRGIPDVTVEIVDVNGLVALTMTANAAGNFFSEVPTASIDLPYTARIHLDGRTREMQTPQTDGACNRCHTDMGVDGAPGRIVLP